MLDIKCGMRTDQAIRGLLTGCLYNNFYKLAVDAGTALQPPLTNTLQPQWIRSDGLHDVLPPIDSFNRHDRHWRMNVTLAGKRRKRHGDGTLRRM